MSSRGEFSLESRPANCDDEAWDRIVKLTEHAVEVRHQAVLQVAQFIVRSKAYWLDSNELIGAILEAIEEKDPDVASRRKRRGDAYLAGLGRGDQVRGAPP